MTDENLVKSILSVLEKMKTESEITEYQGKSIAGDYWIAVLEQLQNNGAAAPNTYRDLLVKNQSKVLSLIAHYTNILHDIEKCEYDRQLDIEYKKVHIKHVKRAYILSIIAIIISILAALIALYQLQGWKLQWICMKLS